MRLVGNVDPTFCLAVILFERRDKEKTSIYCEHDLDRGRANIGRSLHCVDCRFLEQSSGAFS